MIHNKNFYSKPGPNLDQTCPKADWTQHRLDI